MIELNAIRSVAGDRMRGAHDLRLRIHELEDALASRHCRLQDVVFVAQILDRPPEAQRELREHDEHADGDRGRQMQHAETAAPDDERDGDRRKKIDRGVIERVGKDRVFEGDHVLAVDGFKVLVGALFAVEELHHAHAGDVFLRKAVDARNGGAHAAIALAHVVAEDARDDENQRQHGEGQQRQPPTDGEHDSGHDGEHEEVVHDGQNAVGEHVVDGVHVGGEARDQAADGMNVKEADMHALHVAEDVAAQIEHDLLAGPLHQVNLDELEEIRRNQHDEVNRGEARDALHGGLQEAGAQAGC